MTILRLLIGLTLLNLVLLVFTLGVMRPVLGDGVVPVLRGRSLEIVDDTGRVRASLSVHPAGTSAQGDHYPETVLFRLITERGRPTVKISTSEGTAAMSLSGPTNTKNTYVILEATGTASSLKLRNEDGREQVVAP